VSIKISELPAATTPLSGTEAVPIVQAGVTARAPASAFGTTLPIAVQGDLIYGSAPGVYSALAKDTNATRYLSNTGAANNPAWAQVNLANGVTGNLPVANLNSGTGAAATTHWRGDGTWAQVNLANSVSGDLPFSNLTQIAGLSVLGVTGNSAADVAAIAAGTDNQVLRRSGTALTFGAVNLASSDAVTGNLPVTNLNSGTGATNATFWRGDGTWATPAASGELTVATLVADGDGTIVSSHGIDSVTEVSPGSYSVVFTVGFFATPPVVVATLTGPTRNIIALDGAALATDVSIAIQDDAGSPVSFAFNLIAVLAS
jgi:hypothetical protein